MDIDMVLNQFRTMNTNDKDHLISEFRRLSNLDVSNEICSFYLEMAEWNLNTALWAFYEYEGSQNPALIRNMFFELPEMQYLSDITNGEGESIQPNTKFIKSWRIINSGQKQWPTGCKLKFVNGFDFELTRNTPFKSNLSTTSIPIKELIPNETCDLNLELISPEECGIYSCQLRFYTEDDRPFGDEIFIICTVEQTGIMGITQQLTNVNMFDFQRSNSNNSKNNKNNFLSNSNFINPFNSNAAATK